VCLAPNGLKRRRIVSTRRARNDPSGNEVEDTFDDLNRNTSRSVSLVSGFLGTTSETRTFDAVNRMLTTADNDYKVEFGYTVIGLKSYVYTEEQSYVGMTAYAKAVTTTRDANGNPITQAYPSGSSLSLNRTYGDIDQLTQINDGTNVIASFSRIGPRKKITTLQNGATTTLSYTGFRNEIEYVHHETSAPVTISKFGYAYNDVHDRLWETDVLAGTGDAFAYDKMRRLETAWMGSTDVTDPSSNSYTKKIEYNYDDDGNRTSVVVTPYGVGATTTNYSTNNLNEYTSVGGTSQGHDANGNLTDDGTQTYHYDYRNQIVQVKLKSGGTLIASYRYDALGRRVE
jgi:hypothetical protein